MQRSWRTVFATAAMLGGRAWAMLGRIIVTLRLRRPPSGSSPSHARRSYVFGAISRQGFEAALRKARSRRPRS